MLENYRLRIGLVFEAARLLRGKKQNEVASEATDLGYSSGQSSISAVEHGHVRSFDNIWKIAQVLGFDLWVILRIAQELPEDCIETLSGRAKALGATIAHLEEIRDAHENNK